jgi:hypothetical protein
MTSPKRRAYVVPDVKQYGAVEEVTQALVQSGTGDILSHILEILLPGDQPDSCTWRCPS